MTEYKDLSDIEKVIFGIIDGELIHLTKERKKVMLELFNIKYCKEVLKNGK